MFALLTAAGLLLGWVLARLARRGRLIRLAEELKRAEVEVEWLGYIEAALTSYPFGEGIPTVTTALTSARLLRNNARRRVAACQEALGGAGKVKP